MGYFSDTTPRIIMKLFLVVALFASASAYKFKMPDLHRKLQAYGDCSKVEAAYEDVMSAGFDGSSMDDVKDLDAGKMKDGCVEATDEEDCGEDDARETLCGMHGAKQMSESCPECWTVAKKGLEDGEDVDMDSKEC